MVASDHQPWIGTDHGAARWRSGNSAEMITDEQGKALVITVFAIAEDKHKRIWLGSDQGLWVFAEPGRSGMRRVQNDPSKPQGTYFRVHPKFT